MGRTVSGSTPDTDGFIFFSTTFTFSLGSCHPLYSVGVWSAVNGANGEADHYTPSRAEFKDKFKYTSIPHRAFVTFTGANLYAEM